MRILISNDDSIYSEGIQVLYEIAKQITDDVWIVAPQTEQSGASHSLSLRTPLRLSQLDEKRFTVGGTPTDCVLIAVKELMKDKKPDLVLSGINHGSNLAEDITYSGTVAAAMEAALLDIPAIALSQKIDRSKNIYNFSNPIKYGYGLIKRILESNYMHPGSNNLINVNFPLCDVNDVKGFKVAPQGKRVKNENIQKNIDPDNKPYYWIGTLQQHDKDSKGTDLEAVHENFISVTPITLNLTDNNLLKTMIEKF